MAGCPVCGGELTGKQTYCSTRCRVQAHRLRRAGHDPRTARSATFGVEAGAETVEAGKLVYWRRCAWCGVKWSASVPSAQYCSGRCRVAAHRARRRGEAAPAPEAETLPDWFKSFAGIPTF